MCVCVCISIVCVYVYVCLHVTHFINGHMVSNRLTAFVLKSFAQAREFIYIDEKELGSSIAWILGQQRRDGHFPPTGRLINKQIKVGYTMEITCNIGTTHGLEQST